MFQWFLQILYHLRSLVVWSMLTFRKFIVVSLIHVDPLCLSWIFPASKWIQVLSSY